MSKKLTAMLMAASAVLLTACSQQSATPASSSASSQASSSAAATSSSQASATSDSSNQADLAGIDGVYKGTDETDQVTLEVTGNQGTWTKVETDGEKEIKQVSLDPVNQSMVIGDDQYRYRVEGNQLTLEDLEQEFDDKDMIVLTKQ